MHPSFHPPQNRRQNVGTTVVEMLIASAVFGMVATMFYSATYNLVPRLDLRSAADQANFLIVRARLEAIQRGVTTVVEADLENGELRAFADVNGDSRSASPGFAHYLKYDPYWVDGAHVPTLGPRQTDYEIGKVRLERSAFSAPAGLDAVEGFTRIPGAPAGTPPVLVFSATGSPESLGSFRFGDRIRWDGEAMNHLEAAVVSLAGQLEVRKYLHAADAPGGNAGFVPAGSNASGEKLWVWY